MTPRERVLTAMRRGIPDRVPMTMSLCPSQMETFQKKTGASDPAEYFGIEIRNAGPSPIPGARREETLEDGTPVVFDEWGIGWYHTPSSKHFTRMIHPLRNAETAAEIEAYPFPTLDQDERYAELPSRVRQLQEAGYCVMGGAAPVGGTIFWPAYKLRGMEELLVDFAMGSPVADVLIERVTTITVGMARQLARAGVDIVHTADDLGTQRGMMLSMEQFRRYIKPGLKKVVEAAKSANPQVLVSFHSDGDVMELIPEFIEVGIDILNPLQPECIDVNEAKRRFGRDLSFWGAVGTQTTMPFGTAEEVEQCVRDRIHVLGEGGGFMIAPTHMVEPEVPWENVMAFVEAVRKYGSYESVG